VSIGRAVYADRRMKRQGCGQGRIDVRP